MTTGMTNERSYRRSRFGVYPDAFGWRYQVVTPDGGTASAGLFATEKEARVAARKNARFYDQLERDRVDGVVEERTETVLERGLRPCTKCGEPHDLVATTRRGKRWGQTWVKPGCGSYRPESWEEFARKQVAA
jgi:hypothetical protein